MRIPSGDLAPARRRKRYGGAYGRNKRRTGRLVALAVVLVLAVAGGVFLLHRDDGQVTDRLAQAPAPTATASRTACPRTTVKLPAALQPRQVRLVLLNGTTRNGLGKTVGDQLAARGFQVASTANAPTPLAGASHVVWGPGAQAGADLLSKHVLGATVVADARAPRGTLQVVLGSSFGRLRTPGELAALQATKPVTTPCP